MENGANNGSKKKPAGRVMQLLRRANKRVLSIVLAAVLLVVALADGYQYNRSRDITEYVVASATVEKGESFYTDGELKLSGVAGLSYNYLRNNLRLQSSRHFELTKESTQADTALVYFDGPKDRTYELSLRMPRANTTLRWGINEPVMTAELVKSSIVTGESVYIKFSEEVSAQSLRQHISISELTSYDYDVRVTGSIAEIHISSDSQPDYYNIYLPRDITDIHGIAMVDSYHLEVAVRPQRTTVKRPYRVSLTGGTTEILKPGQPLKMELVTDGLYWPTEEVTVTAYQFASIDNYLKTSELYNLSNENFYDPVQSDSLAVINTGTAALRQGSSQVTFTDPGPGAYLLEGVYHNPLSDKTQRVRKMILVTDLMLYAQSVNGQTLLWLNSIATGGPLGGHSIEFVDSKGDTVLSAATNAEGIATTDAERNPYEDPDWYHWVRVRNGAGETVYADTTNVLTWNWGGQNDRYFSYFYLDRGIYKPNDEINFWGYIKGHQSNATPTPGQVRVVFDAGGLEIEVMADVDAQGIFHGAIPLEKVKSANYSVSMTIPHRGFEWKRNDDGAAEQVERTGHRTLQSEYIQVQEFQKPLFVISAENDKDFYNYDDEVTVTVTPKFYDGTPLPNYELEYVVYDHYYGEEVTTESVLTDDEGKAVIKFPAYQIRQQPIGWRPATGRYKVMIKSDGEDISYTGTYTYMPTDRMLRTSTEVDADCKATLKATVNSIDISPVKTLADLQAITRANYYYYNDTYEYDSEEYEKIVGKPLDTAVVANITLYYYTYLGKYTDITKSLEMKATGGNAEEKIDLAEFFGVKINTGSSCRLEVRYEVEDAMERTVAYTQSAYKASRSVEGRSSSGGLDSSSTAGSEPQEPQFYEGYSFAVTNDKGENAVGDFVPYQDYDFVWFNAGENFHLTLQYDGKPVPNNGRILYTVIQDKIIARSFTGESQLSFTQSTRYASNINIVAAYFDGRNVHPIRDTVVGLATDSIRLNVEAVPDKAEYRPGEETTVSVKITDVAGAGVQSSVCLSIVDEAIFALREQHTEVLNTLYSDSHYYNYYVRKYSTTERGVPEDGMGDGGKGDGGDVIFDESTRKNFRDTAIFRNVRTDENGVGTLTFTLPDNITSWRITSLAIGDNLYAGQSQDNFITTQPFFISPVVSEKYIAGDDVALQVRGYGTALPPGADVNFTVTMEGDNYSKTFTAQAKAFAASHINFGQLPIGEYTLTATAQHAQSRDTVELPVTVISSNLELVVNRPVDLSKPLEMNVMRYPVTMSFYNSQHEPYFQTIGLLLRHYCMIANQRMSRYTAKRALMSFMEPDDVPRYLLDGTDSVSDMQNSDGGIAWYDGRESDIELSAKVLLLAGDQFNHNTMKAYFKRAIEQYGYDLSAPEEGQDPSKMTAKPKEGPDRTLVCYAYLGLAALGEPVVEEIYTILALPDNRPEQQALLVAALAYAGDGGAPAAYQKYITPLVDRRVEGASARYYTDPKDGSDGDITSAAWIASSKLNLADADQFALHFAQNRWAIRSLFEAMIYVTNYDKPVSPLLFSYESNGEVHEVDMGFTGRTVIKLDQSAFESFKMLTVPDDLSATAYYIGEPSEANIEASDNLGIKKDIKPLGNGGYDITLTMTFGDGAETGQYDISDWVPSNLRVYDMKRHYSGGEYSHWSAYSSAEGQKLYFRLWRDSSSCKTASITYTVREVFDAGAMLDSTYIIHGDSGDSGFTERKRWDIPS